MPYYPLQKSIGKGCVNFGDASYTKKVDNQKEWDYYTWNYKMADWM